MKKRVLITGASSGLGKRVAEKLLSEGFTVYAAARSVEKMEELKERGASILKMDVTDDDSVKRGVAQLLQEQGGIDTLVSNAGYGLYGPIEDVPLKEIERQFNVNLYGNARLLKAVLPSMRQQRSGRILFTSSVVGKVSPPILGWYAASKHAVEAMADALWGEVRRLGIDVIKIEPGAVKTGFDTVALGSLDNITSSPEYKDQISHFKTLFEKFYSECEGPEGTAALIVKAIKAKRPKTTYVTTKDAKRMIFLKRFLGERRLGEAILKILNQAT